MSRQSYAREKLGVAVDALATGTGTLQARLLNAYMSFHPLQPRDFESDEDQTKYKSVMERLTSVKDGDPERGFVQNTLDQMDDDTARSIAEDIVELNHSVRRS